MNTPTTTWCQTCGNPVEDGVCNCWGHVANALQRYFGMSFDASAALAAEMWEQHAYKEYVWAAKYADDHTVETFPDTRGFAPAGVREQDRRAYPHDADCPKCGRRQWGDEDAQETCQACGYTMPDDDGCPECGDLLSYAGPFNGSEGVTGGHEGFGETYICPDAHWFAFIQGAYVPPSHVLTVVERG